MNVEKLNASKYFGKVQETVKFAETLRTDKDYPVDITLAEVVKEKFECELEDFDNELGIDPSVDTINNIFTVGDLDVRWIIPELI